MLILFMLLFYFVLFFSLKYSHDSGIFSNNPEPISFRLGMLIDMTKLSSLVPVWSTFAFTLGHTVRRKLEFCSHSVVKRHQVAQSFAMVYYVREMTVRKPCMYGHIGSSWVFGLLVQITGISITCTLKQVIDGVWPRPPTLSVGTFTKRLLEKSSKSRETKCVSLF